MKRTTKICRAVVLTLVFVQTVNVDAASAEARKRDTATRRLLGGRADFAWQQLPPGRLRDRVERLDPAARQRAQEWLRSFSFPPEDVGSLHADLDGGMYYVDHFPVDAVAAAETSETSASDTVAQDVAPFPTNLHFHSKPGSAHVLYLDFDGETVTQTVWNRSLDREAIPALPYSADDDHTTFSASEQTDIERIWQRVAEDYAPFDIDVTTERPATWDRHTAHVLITRHTDANGQDNPSASAGGVAYVNVFGNHNYAYYRPAWIYADNLHFTEHYIAEAAAHEVGHNLGLSHDGQVDGVEYYGGHGSGDTSWAPIMGLGYGRNVSQWSRGEYERANNTEDDMAIIAGKLQFRTDAHGTAPADAVHLTVSGGSNIVSTTPATDAANTRPENKGIIEQDGDVDWFAFSTRAGEIHLSVQPWISPASYRGGNLDLRAAILDQDGVSIAEANVESNTTASLTLTLPEGQYYLRVAGTGTGDPYGANPLGYTSYGSVGQYFITGQVVARQWDLVATVNDPEGGGVQPAGGVYPDAAVVCLTATPGTYFSFVQWEGDIAGSNAVLDLTMNTNKIVCAVFDPIRTRTHATPYWWLAQYGVTNEFEQAAERIGANGMALWESYIAGADPDDPNDAFAVRAATATTHGGTRLEWSSVSGRVYSVFSSADLRTGFEPVPGATNLPWTSNVYEAPFTNGPAFYRLGVSIAPPTNE